MVRAASKRNTVVSVIPRSTAGGVLILRQRSRVGILVPSCPGGRVEAGETYTATFARESFEELGVSVAKKFETPDYYVELQREDQVVFTAVFEHYCPELGYKFSPREGDKVESASWYSRENALRIYLQSPARHIAEPLVSHLSGQVRSVFWRYDTNSARIPMRHSTPIRPSACVSGHFEVRGSHTELIGVPAQYLLKPSTLVSAAANVAALIRPYCPESLITPAVGGVALASAVAIRLNLPLAVVERTPDGHYCRSRGAPVSSRTALIDSTFHSGKTVTAILDFIRAMGGSLITSAVAVKSLVANEQLPMPVPIPVHALETIVVHAWKPDACPLCLRGVPLDNRPARYEGNIHGEPTSPQPILGN